jgi:hypothetical protein
LCDLDDVDDIIERIVAVSVMALSSGAKGKAVPRVAAVPTR